jgi:hypothetical protein
MEKKPKVKEQVIILAVPWNDDSIYVGMVVKLDNKESKTEWASATVDGFSVVISKYVPATELNKALF